MTEASLKLCAATHPPITYYGLLCPLCHEGEATRQLQQENERLEAEIQRLQRALHFWMPGVPADDPEIAERAGNDAMLLVGFDPTEPVELDAEALDWIELRAPPIRELCPECWKPLPCAGHPGDKP